MRTAPLALLLLLAATPAAAHHTDAVGGCLGGGPALFVPPRNGDGYIHLAQRYARPGVRWREIRNANGRRAVQVGRRVGIPLDLLDPGLRPYLLRSLFPADGYRDGAWVHVTGQESARRCKENSALFAEWFAGDPSLGGDLARLNDVSTGSLPGNTRVRIPREMLLAAFVPEDAGEEPVLAFGEDDQGAFAVYRLRPGEALYTSVVIRFTGRLDADEVNQLAREIAARSGIDDVRGIPIGYPIRIPRELLAPRHLPEGDPARIEWERDRTEVARHRVQARARRLGGVHVILDAGHGGVDVGTTKQGMDEDEYVYDVMCRIKRRLERDTDAMVLTTIEDRVTGYDVRDVKVLSRDRNEWIRTTPPYQPEDPNLRAMGVNLRWYLANSFYRRLVDRGIDPEKIVFVSLHADSLHPTISGAMVYIPGEKYRRGRYGSGQAVYADFEEVREKIYVKFDRGERLRAEGMSRQFAAELVRALEVESIPVHRYEPVRDHVIRRKRSWVPAVIRCSETPLSLLVELVNLNNAGDRERMQDPEFRERLAGAFVNGLEEFYRASTGPEIPAARASVAAGAP
ncbi:MAG: N-acetylmuramoyl-L-alanine amidase [Acidobacteriota bacterium]